MHSVLPFNSSSNTGNSVLIRGFGPTTFSVPQHRINLQSGLVQGNVTVGVCSSLPVDGVDVLLGNNLTGSCVWANTSPPLLVTETPAFSGEHDELARDLDVFSACVVTRAAHHATKELEVDREATGPLESFLSWEEIPSSVSREQLAKEQREDPLIQPLFERVESNNVNVANGYFVSAGVLCRRWAPHTGQVVGEPLIQIVIPETVRPLILQTAHDNGTLRCQKDL